MTGRLDGRRAIVTGASRGIGAGIAQRLAAEGAAVAIVARTVDEPDRGFDGTLARTAEMIRAAGGTVAIVPAALEDPDSRARIVPESEKALGDRSTSSSTMRRPRSSSRCGATRPSVRI